MSFLFTIKLNKGGANMRDIGSTLSNIMSDKQCSSICAFFLLSEQKVGDKDGLCKLQPKPKKKTGRRLRDKSNF